MHVRVCPSAAALYGALLAHTFWSHRRRGKAQRRRRAAM
jgi:hypothetical protein